MGKSTEVVIIRQTSPESRERGCGERVEQRLCYYQSFFYCRRQQSFVLFFSLSSNPSFFSSSQIYRGPRDAFLSFVRTGRCELLSTFLRKYSLDSLCTPLRMCLCVQVFGSCLSVEKLRKNRFLCLLSGGNGYGL